MKHSKLIIACCFVSQILNAQTHKYEIELLGNLPFATHHYSPTGITDVSPIGFKHSTVGRPSANFKMLLDANNKIGVFIAFEEFDYGYYFRYSNSPKGIGDNEGGGANYCDFLKFGLSYERILMQSKRFQFGGSCHLNIGKQYNGEKYNDTTIANSIYRNTTGTFP